METRVLRATKEKAQFFGLCACYLFGGGGWI